MKNISKPKVSILIVNYNNALFLKRCITSVLKQDYDNKEIVVVDDQSSDNSFDILKKFKNKIILLKNNKKKFYVGAYDQMRAYKIALQKSSGKIIFFLDSDDFFIYNKIKKMVNYFEKSKEENIFMDRPIIFYNKNKKLKLTKRLRGNVLIPWPRFSPQSCISIRRDYLKKIYKIISIKKYPTIWLDFRIVIFNFIKNKKINLVNEFLTYYQQSENSASSNYKLFSKNWWLRRHEAHNYFNYINKKKHYSLDFCITNFLIFFFCK
jgi:glycosyltransferase involved in cell wall biosynthesis